MEVHLSVKCYDCQHQNIQQMGVPGYELVETEFDSFSAAFNHALLNPDHSMYFDVRVDNGQQ